MQGNKTKPFKTLYLSIYPSTSFVSIPVCADCQVANVKKETSLHWYKEEDEIVPETPPSVTSGSCALPIPLVTTEH